MTERGALGVEHYPSVGGSDEADLDATEQLGTISTLMQQLGRIGSELRRVTSQTGRRQQNKGSASSEACVLVDGAAEDSGTCEAVDAVMVTSGGRHPTEFMGVYLRTSTKPGSQNDGRQIYRNSNRRLYLFFWAPSGRWAVGADYHEAHASLASNCGEGTWCPTRATGWSIYFDKEWHVDSDIRVMEASSDTQRNGQTWSGGWLPRALEVSTSSPPASPGSSPSKSRLSRLLPRPIAVEPGMEHVAIYAPDDLAALKTEINTGGAEMRSMISDASASHANAEEKLARLQNETEMRHELQCRLELRNMLSEMAEMRPAITDELARVHDVLMKPCSLDAQKPYRRPYLQSPNKSPVLHPLGCQLALTDPLDCQYPAADQLLYVFQDASAQLSSGSYNFQDAARLPPATFESQRQQPAGALRSQTLRAAANTVDLDELDLEHCFEELVVSVSNEAPDVRRPGQLRSQSWTLLRNSDTLVRRQSPVREPAGGHDSPLSRVMWSSSPYCQNSYQGSPRAGRDSDIRHSSYRNAAWSDEPSESVATSKLLAYSTTGNSFSLGRSISADTSLQELLQGGTCTTGLPVNLSRICSPERVAPSADGRRDFTERVLNDSFLSSPEMSAPSGNGRASPTVADCLVAMRALLEEHSDNPSEFLAARLLRREQTAPEQRCCGPTSSPEVCSELFPHQAKGQSEDLTAAEPDNLAREQLGIDGQASTTSTASVQAGATAISVANYSGFEIGRTVDIAPGTARHEVKKVQAFGSLIFDCPFQFAHPAGTVLIAHLSCMDLSLKPSSTLSAKPGSRPSSSQSSSRGVMKRRSVNRRPSLKQRDAPAMPWSPQQGGSASPSFLKQTDVPDAPWSPQETVFCNPPFLNQSDAPDPPWSPRERASSSVSFGRQPPSLGVCQSALAAVAPTESMHSSQLTCSSISRLEGVAITPMRAIAMRDTAMPYIDSPEPLRSPSEKTPSTVSFDSPRASLSMTEPAESSAAPAEAMCSSKPNSSTRISLSEAAIPHYQSTRPEPPPGPSTGSFSSSQQLSSRVSKAAEPADLLPQADQMYSSKPTSRSQNGLRGFASSPMQDTSTRDIDVPEPPPAPSSVAFSSQRPSLSVSKDAEPAHLVAPAEPMYSSMPHYRSQPEPPPAPSSVAYSSRRPSLSISEADEPAQLLSPAEPLCSSKPTRSSQNGLNGFASCPMQAASMRSPEPPQAPSTSSASFSSRRPSLEPPDLLAPAEAMCIRKQNYSNPNTVNRGARSRMQAPSKRSIGIPEPPQAPSSASSSSRQPSLRASEAAQPPPDALWSPPTTVGSRRPSARRDSPPDPPWSPPEVNYATNRPARRSGQGFSAGAAPSLVFHPEPALPLRHLQESPRSPLLHSNTASSDNGSECPPEPPWSPPEAASSHPATLGYFHNINSSSSAPPPVMLGKRRSRLIRRSREERPSLVDPGQAAPEAPWAPPLSDGERPSKAASRQLTIDVPPCASSNASATSDLVSIPNRRTSRIVRRGSAAGAQPKRRMSNLKPPIDSTTPTTAAPSPENLSNSYKSLQHDGSTGGTVKTCMSEPEDRSRSASPNGKPRCISPQLRFGMSETEDSSKHVSLNRKGQRPEMEMGVDSQRRAGSLAMQVEKMSDGARGHATDQICKSNEVSQSVAESRPPVDAKDHSMAKSATAKNMPDHLSDEYWRGKEWAAALFPDAPPMNKPRVDKVHKPHVLHRSGSMLEKSQRPNVRVMRRPQRLRKTLRNEGCADGSSNAVGHNSIAASGPRISILRPVNSPRPMVGGQSDGNQKVTDCHNLELEASSRDIAVESPRGGETPAGLFVSPHSGEAPANLLVSNNGVPRVDHIPAGVFVLPRADSANVASPGSSASFADGAESVASDELLEGEDPEDPQNLAGSFKPSAYRRPDISYWSSPAHEDAWKKTESTRQLSPESPSFEHGLLTDDFEKTIKLGSSGRLGSLARTRDLAPTPGVASLAGSPGTEATSPNASMPPGTPLSAPMTPDKRQELINCMFAALDTKHTGRLKEGEMYNFAKAMDYPEDKKTYAEEYKCVCESEELEPKGGIDKKAFKELVDVEDGDYFIGDASLQSVLEKVIQGQTCERKSLKSQRSLLRSQSSQSSGISEQKSQRSLRSQSSGVSELGESGEEESRYESAEEESRASDEEVSDSEEEDNESQRNTSSYRKARSSRSRSSSKLASEDQSQQLGTAVTDATEATDARSSFNSRISKCIPMTDAVASARISCSTDAVDAARSRSSSPTKGTESAGMESAGSSEFVIEEEEEEEQHEHDSEVETDEE